MWRKYFLFFTVTVLVISIYPWWQTLPFQVQLTTSILTILFVGVPHGAIDHVLWFRGKDNVQPKKMTFFIIRYLSLIAIYVLLWVVFPYLSLFFFFIMSFYHFGQSQFFYLQVPERSPIKISLYVLWGCSIISAIFYHHYGTLIQFFNETDHFVLTSQWITSDFLRILFLSSSILSIFGILYAAGKSDIIVRELIAFFILHLAFYILPPLLGFTLYFTVWHSVGMLVTEYGYLKEEQSNVSIVKFIKLLFPLSSVSIVGALIVLWAFNAYNFSISPFFLIIIFLSVLTLPHSWVMQKWFTRKNLKLKKAGTS